MAAWYEELFLDGDSARAYVESDNSRAQVDFIIDKLELQPGARVMDLCCGMGRHLIELTRRGYDVVGVDLSEFMLAKLGEYAAKEGIQPTLVRSDMREIDFNSEFDAVINMATAFGYLESDEENEKVIHAVSRALKPGGRFLIDVQNRDGLMRIFRPRDWQVNEAGDVMYSDRGFDCVTGRVYATERTMRADGSRFECTHFIRLYTCNEYDAMFQRAGLRFRTVFGGFDGSELKMDSRRLIVIAEKPA